MTTISNQAILNYSAKQIYDLVNDVAAYPEFLPWCHATTVIEQSNEAMVASLTVKKAAIEKSFTTENSLIPYESISMNLVDGPFSHMKGLWQFVELAEDACKVSFSLDFSFNSKVLTLTLGPLFSKIADTMVSAFEQRAIDVYGAKSD